MQPDITVKVTCWMKNFLTDELAKLRVTLGKGLAINKYQLLDNTRRTLEASLSILEIFDRNHDQYCVRDSVKNCIELIEKRLDERWKSLPRNERLRKVMAGVGFLAVDMGLSDEAESLFQVLSQLEPDNVHPLLGLTYSKLCNGSVHEALSLIQDKVLNISPDSDLGIAFLSATYNALNRPEEALAAASAVIAANRDESAVILAREVRNSIGLNAA